MCENHALKLGTFCRVADLAITGWYECIEVERVEAAREVLDSAGERDRREAHFPYESGEADVKRVAPIFTFRDEVSALCDADASPCSHE